MTIRSKTDKVSLKTKLESEYKLQNMVAFSLLTKIMSAAIQTETALLHGSLEASG